MFPDAGNFLLSPVQAVFGETSTIGWLSYVLPSEDVPVLYAYEPPFGVPWESGEFHNFPVRISDARVSRSKPKVHIEGFELVDSPTRVGNFDDREEIFNVYYDEVLQLALEATGGAYGYVFDHLVRKRDPSSPTLSFGRKTKAGCPSINGRVHNDYTEASGPRRFELVLGEGMSPVHRFCIVNVWRPIGEKVVDAPLALCDARTVAAADPVASEVRYPSRTGEIYLFKHAPQHRWYYFSEMGRHEAVVFKQFDSQLSGTSRFTPHSAFDHPDTPRGTPPRQSIEARVLVVFE